jgi:hypothetical protein
MKDREISGQFIMRMGRKYGTDENLIRNIIRDWEELWEGKNPFRDELRPPEEEEVHEPVSVGRLSQGGGSPRNNRPIRSASIPIGNALNITDAQFNAATQWVLQHEPLTQPIDERSMFSYEVTDTSIPPQPDEVVVTDQMRGNSPSTWFNPVPPAPRLSAANRATRRAR